MYCPHCKEEITELKYDANYSEVTYGSCWGTYDIESEDHTLDDQESGDTDNFEEDNYTYRCPECDRELDIDELLEEIEEEDEEEIEDKIERKNIQSVKRMYEFMKKS